MQKPSFKPFTWAKFTAILCVIGVLFNLLALVGSDLFWMTKPLKEATKDYKEARQTLKGYEKELKETEEAFASVMEKNGDKLEKLEKENKKATEELEDVCSNGYYSYYGSCRYRNCRSLHTAAEEAEEALTEFKKDLKIDEYEEKTADLKDSIQSAKDSVKYAKERQTDYQKSFFNTIFSLIGYLLRCAGRLLLAFYLFTERESKLLGLVSLGIVGLGDLLFLIASKINGVFIPFSPYFWDILILGIFALIIWKEKDFSRRGLVALRVTAIILALLQMIILLITMNLSAPLSATILILISFVLVPINFKEYTKVSLHIFLSIVTLGIWLLVWFYHVTKNLNKVESMENRKPVNELLLCAFLPFYGIYFMLKNAEYIEAYGAEKGKKYSISILCFLVAFVSPLLSTVFMQDKINEIVGKPE